MSGRRRLLASWEHSGRIWFRWPEELRGPQLERARECATALCSRLDELGTNAQLRPAKRLEVLARSDHALRSARVALGALDANLRRTESSSAWDGRESLLFGREGQEPVVWLGQGTGRFDEGRGIAAECRVRAIPVDWSFERGALETDGEGTALLTREHWLQSGLNEPWTVDELEGMLKETFGLERVLWLDRGLPGDPVGGQVHRVARFIAPGRVLCCDPGAGKGASASVQHHVLRSLRHFRDASGRPLEVLTVPAADATERPAASPLGFLRVGNAILVPSFPGNDEARMHDAFAEIFPTARIVLMPAPVELGAAGSLMALTMTGPA